MDNLNDEPSLNDVAGLDGKANLGNHIELLDELMNNVSVASSNDTSQFKKEILIPNHAELIIALDYLLFLMLILIMLAMGCKVTTTQLWGHIKRPVGLTIGIVSQFGIKPLAAFLILLACGVDGIKATGVLIISCCPGGVLSNTFTYFSDGDLPLSVAMTTASTVMAMAMLPANMWLYGRHFETVNLVIPYQKMAVSLLIVTSPICLGMLLKWKLPRIAKWTTKIGTYTGLLLMLASCVIEVIIFPNMFSSIQLRLYLIILMLPVVGLGLGYGIAALLKQKVPVCKTIAIECGIQNFPLALTIIALSFPPEMQAKIVLLPWLYGFAMISGSTIICGIYQLHKKFKPGKNVDETELPNMVKEGMDDPEKEDLMLSNHLHVELKPSILQSNSNGQTNV